MLGNLIDDGAPDHHAVGVAGDLGRIVGVLDAEANRDRQAGMALDPLHRLADAGVIGERRPGDAGQRDIIDEARRVVEHGGSAMVVRRRRGEADEVQPCAQRGNAKLGILLRRQIDDDEAIDASGNANSVSATTPMVPAMNEPIAETASAAPARPFCAMA